MQQNDEREENESKKTNRRVITRKRNQFRGDKTVGFYTFKGNCVSSWNYRTRALVEMSNPRGKFHICHRRSDGWVLQGMSTHWEARALRTIWGKLWLGKWLGTGVRAVAFERKKKQQCSCQDRVKRGVIKSFRCCRIWGEWCLKWMHLPVRLLEVTAV